MNKYVNLQCVTDNIYVSVQEGRLVYMKCEPFEARKSILFVLPSLNAISVVNTFHICAVKFRERREYSDFLDVEENVKICTVRKGSDVQLDIFNYATNTGITFRFPASIMALFQSFRTLLFLTICPPDLSYLSAFNKIIQRLHNTLVRKRNLFLNNLKLGVDTDSLISDVLREENIVNSFAYVVANYNLIETRIRLDVITQGTYFVLILLRR